MEILIKKYVVGTQKSRFFEHPKHMLKMISTCTDPENLSEGVPTLPMFFFFFFFFWGGGAGGIQIPLQRSLFSAGEPMMVQHIILLNECLLECLLIILRIRTGITKKFLSFSRGGEGSGPRPSTLIHA